MPESAAAQTFASCDARTECIGAALRLRGSSGAGAQYVDVRRTASQSRLETALTFEAWALVERAPNLRQFIAGLWGPNTDDNDVWALYIAPNDDIVFEINGAETSLGALDNTTARAPFAARYGVWTHIAARFDGQTQTATLFLNGVEVASARNAMFPASRLRRLQTPSLQMQIGSTNALNNIGEQNASLRGALDEIRLWSRALEANEILCGLYSSLQGSESGLVLYYRCNETQSAITLCDASGNGNAGDLRSGARCEIPAPARTLPPLFSAQPAAITDAFLCERSRAYSVRVRNLSAACGEEIHLSLVGKDAGEFRLSPDRLRLQPGEEGAATLTFLTERAGGFEADVRIARANRCGDTALIPLRLARSTNIQPSEESLQMGTLYAGCREQPFVERRLRLRNAGGAAIRLESAAFGQASPFRVVSGAFPQTLAAQAETEIVARFFAADSAGAYFDTLRVRTDDACQPTLAVPIQGTIEEAVIVRRGYGLARLDSVNFGRECPETGISDPQAFTWESGVTGGEIRIDTVVAPPFIRVRSLRYPVVLRSDAFAEPNFLRFAPITEGAVFDSVIIRAVIVATSATQGGGFCTFEKKIYVSGRGSAARIILSPAAFDAGATTVGQERTFTVSAQNPSAEDTVRALVFLRRGENFFLSGARTLTLPPLASVQIPVSFRPRAEGNFTDELCAVEQRCFFTVCAGLQGRGEEGVFRFDSALTEISGVLGCASRTDTILITNRSASEQVLTNIRFVNPSGRFQILSGIDGVTVVSTSIPAGGVLPIIVRYAPNDLQQDRADAAEFLFTAAGESWKLVIRGSSAAPRLFVPPVTAFGTVEIGDARLDTVTVENISSVALSLDELTLPAGYAAFWSERPLPAVLQPRETVRVGVRFAPLEERRYDGDVVARSFSPCPTEARGRFQGRGARAGLEIGANPVNIGFTRPCECRTATTTAFNASFAHAVTVESATVADSETDEDFSAPEYFTWTSTLSPEGTTPYAIPPQATDTLTIRFCPRSLSLARNVLNAASLVLRAQSPTLSQRMRIDLTGRRTLLFTPTPARRDFPPTLLGVETPPLNVRFSAPTSPSQNPAPAPVRIDSMLIIPADGLASTAEAFRVIAPLPGFTVRPREADIQTLIAFRPTEARPYLARLALYQSEPCFDVDTTVLLTGVGFIGALGLPFRFNNAAPRLDTFRVTTCGTLVVPVYSARSLKDSVNIRLRFAFDTTRFRILGVRSEILPPDRIASRSTSGGVELRATGARLDSLRALFLVELAPSLPRRGSYRLALDSIEVRAASGEAFGLIPAGAFAEAIVEEIRIDASSPPGATLDFGATQIYDCREEILTIRNTGDRAVQGFSLTNLPPSLTIARAEPPLADIVPPGGTLRLTVRHCPLTEDSLGGGVSGLTLGVRAAEPCEAATHANAQGRGVRTDLAIRFSFTSATLSGRLGDTVALPLVLNNDIAATIGGARRWLRNFDFSLDVAYSPYSLKFIGAEAAATTGGTMRLSARSSFLPPSASLQGALRLNFSGVDSLRAGVVAVLRFVVAAPDTLVSALRVSADSASFRTDSLQFLRILTEPSFAVWTTNERCNIAYLPLPEGGVLKASLEPSYPNPARQTATIAFTLVETVPASLTLYNSLGEPVATLLDGRQILPGGGRYEVEFDAQYLPPGAYFYVLRAGVFTATRQMLIVR
jgi:hypothetical protein